MELCYFAYWLVVYFVTFLTGTVVVYVKRTLFHFRVRAHE